MSHKKIWKATRELEDQQQADYKRVWSVLKRLTEAREFQRVDETNIRALFEQVKKLEKHIDKLCVRVFDLENSFDDLAVDHIPPAVRQVDKLANYILEDISGEPNQSEGAADTAIRLLKRYRAALESVTQQLSIIGVGHNVSAAYRIAWEALDASSEQGDDAV